jgi:hypothetical protein
MVNGKPDYSDYPNEDSPPFFVGVTIYTEAWEVNVDGDDENLIGLSGGTMTLNPVDKIVTTYAGEGGYEDDPADGPVTFYLVDDEGEAALGNENGLYAEFRSYSTKTGNETKNETAFSGTPYHIESGNIEINGTFGVVRSLNYYMEELKCAPYVETILNSEGKISKIKYRFVNPETLETVSNPDIYMGRNDVRFYLNNGDRIVIGADEGARYYDGKEHTIAIPSNLGPFEPGDIDYLSIRFSYKSDNPNGEYPDAVGPNFSWTKYKWDFFGDLRGEYEPASTTPPGSTPEPTPEPTPVPIPEPTPEPSPAPDIITLPNNEDVQQAESVAGTNLTETPAVFEAAESVGIKTNSQVNFAGEEITRERTISAISIEQEIEAGGAVLLGTVTLPLASESLGGIVMQDVNDFDDLAEKYSVMKGFDGGGVVDLLRAYGRRAFDYDNGKVVIKPAIIIIDDSAPSIDADIIRPFANDVFGVKLSSDNSYLYIYDGDKNGVAQDPIALVARANDEPENVSKPDEPANSGRGCSASGYTFALFALICLPCLIKTRRNGA